jgi:hypothetical protein
MRAASFHESVSVRRLGELFQSPLNQVFAKAVASECQQCHARFAIFLQLADDPDNAAYTQEITKTIAADCKDGKHPPEIILD